MKPAFYWKITHNKKIFLWRRCDVPALILLSSKFRVDSRQWQLIHLNVIAVLNKSPKCLFWRNVNEMPSYLPTLETPQFANCKLYKKQISWGTNVSVSFRISRQQHVLVTICDYKIFWAKHFLRHAVNYNFRNDKFVIINSVRKT